MNIAPRDFWTLSLTEWRWLLAAVAPSERLSLGELSALAAAYPDIPPSSAARTLPPQAGEEGARDSWRCRATTSAFSSPVYGGGVSEADGGG